MPKYSDIYQESMASFSRGYDYNSPTTKKPVICQFTRNALSINSSLRVGYKKRKNCERFQCTF